MDIYYLWCSEPPVSDVVAHCLGCRHSTGQFAGLEHSSPTSLDRLQSQSCRKPIGYCYNGTEYIVKYFIGGNKCSYMQLVKTMCMQVINLSET